MKLEDIKKIMMVRQLDGFKRGVKFDVYQDKSFYLAKVGNTVKSQRWLVTALKMEYAKPVCREFNHVEN